MRIGLTYDLRDDYLAMGFASEALAEFDTRETIDEIAAAIARAGHDVDRIGNVRRLAARLVAGERWDLVFNIAEGLAGRSREAQVPALLEAFDQPYLFSDPLTCAATLDKAVAKRLVRDAGVPTAPFVVLDGDGDEVEVGLPFPVFVKPISEGTGKGCDAASLAHDTASLAAAAGAIRARFAQPAIAETFLPGREFTVGIVGNGQGAEVVGVMEIIVLDATNDTVYSFENKELCESRVRYSLMDDDEATLAGRTALDAYRALEVRDAGRVDVRSDAGGVPNFLEVNPLAGLHPTHSDLPILAGLAGIAYDDLVARIIAAGGARYDLTRRVVRKI